MQKAKITISTHVFVEDFNSAEEIAKILAQSIPLVVQQNGFYIIVENPDYGIVLYD